MGIGSISNTAFDGIRRGMERAQQGAIKVAGTGQKQPGFEQTVRGLVELKEANNQVKASAVALKAGNDALGTLLDVLA